MSRIIRMKRLKKFMKGNFVIICIKYMKKELCKKEKV